MARVSVIVLAAGRSSRFVPAVEHKLLARVAASSVVRLSVQAAVDADVGDVIVVTGAAAAAVESALAGLDVRLVHEPAFADGMATSLGAGLRAVTVDTPAVLIALGDQPLMRPEAYRRVVAAWRVSAAPIVVPRYARQDGPSHPVLFATEVFDELLAVRGDVGARDVIARDPARVASVELEWAAPRDVDTAEDLAAIAHAAGSLPDTTTEGRRDGA